MSVLLTIIGILAGLLGAGFLVQTVTSFIILLVAVAALAFSKVDKAYSLGMTAVGASQVAFHGVLTGAAYWVANRFLDLTSMNLASIVLLIGAALVVLYGISQVPGKLLLARRTVWDIGFQEQMMATPRGPQRITLAKEWKR